MNEYVIQFFFKNETQTYLDWVVPFDIRWITDFQSVRIAH